MENNLPQISVKRELEFANVLYKNPTGDAKVTFVSKEWGKAPPVEIDLQGYYMGNMESAVLKHAKEKTPWFLERDFTKRPAQVSSIQVFAGGCVEYVLWRVLDDGGTISLRSSMEAPEEAFSKLLGAIARSAANG